MGEITSSLIYTVQIFATINWLKRDLKNVMEVKEMKKFFKFSNASLMETNFTAILMLDMFNK